MLWVGKYVDILESQQRQPSLSLSFVSKKQNKTTTKNFIIFCRKTISKIMWKKNLKK